MDTLRIAPDAGSACCHRLHSYSDLPCPSSTWKQGCKAMLLNLGMAAKPSSLIKGRLADGSPPRLYFI